MNNILELIRNEDVKWVKLGDVCEIKSGQNISKMDIEKNKGIYPVINSGKEPLGFFNKWNTENDPIGITTRGVGVGSITYQEGKYFRGSLNYSVTVKDKDFLFHKFLYYLLNNMQSNIHKLCTFNGIPALNSSSLKELEIPIPSLETQRKIVDILDRYTKSYEELKGCLAKEKDLRIKQYEYYRDKLLSEEYLIKKTKELCEIDVSLKQLCIKDVVKIKNGKDWKHLNKGDVPVYGSGGEMNIYVDKYMYDKDSVLIPRKGSINNVFYLDKPFWNIDTIFYTEINEKELIPKYFYYFISNYNIGALSSINSSTRPSLTQSQLNEILITLPPLKVQEYIVEILDKFDKLTNDIKEGLPKEIELRTKQYEYYREKLLNFKK